MSGVARRPDSRERRDRRAQGRCEVARREAIGKEVYYVAIKFHAATYDCEKAWQAYGLTSGGAESLDAAAQAWSDLPRSATFDGSD